MPQGQRHIATDETRAQVSALRGVGLTGEEIATFMGVSRQTLYAHYKDELDKGAVRSNAAVARALYTNAVSNNNVTAQIWWTKTRMGWKETTTVENVGPGGGPMQHELVENEIFDHLTDDELLEMQRLMNVAAQRRKDGGKASPDEPSDE